MHHDVLNRVWIDGKQVLGVHERWKHAAPISITFTVARMLAVNGAMFDDLVHRGRFTPGQVNDALVRLLPADPTIFATATAAGYRDRTDDIITANTLLRADTRTDDANEALNEVRNQLWFLADTGYVCRWNLPS